MAKAANSYRFERKFFVSDLDCREIEMLIKLHPSVFREIYHHRYINNIYLDSIDLASYFDNIDGGAFRKKYRIRWYGDLFGGIEKPVLEIKIKKGLMGTKESYPLEGFSIDEDFNKSVLAEVFNNSAIPYVLKQHLLNMEPALINRYGRQYYQSADRKYRMTLDNELQFYAVKSRSNTFLHCHTDYNGCVVELKYEREDDRNAPDIANLFPFRMTRNSKYLKGIDFLVF